MFSVTNSQTILQQETFLIEVTTNFLLCSPMGTFNWPLVPPAWLSSLYFQKQLPPTEFSLLFSNSLALADWLPLFWLIHSLTQGSPWLKIWLQCWQLYLLLNLPPNSIFYVKQIHTGVSENLRVVMNSSFRIAPIHIAPIHIAPIHISPTLFCLLCYLNVDDIVVHPRT